MIIDNYEGVNILFENNGNASLILFKVYIILILTIYISIKTSNIVLKRSTKL